MIHADMALAKRLERAEGSINQDIILARKRMDPDRGATFAVIAGLDVFFDGSGSALTQTFGLGMRGEPYEALLDKLEAFFEERGAPVFHQICPLARGDVAARLAARGYRPIEHSNVLYLDTNKVWQKEWDTNPAILTREVADHEIDAWVEVAAAGWSDSPESADQIADLLSASARSAFASAVIARLDGTPVATALSHTAEDVAVLGWASTIPSARRRGAQRELMLYRLGGALSEQCYLAMIVAEPGSASQRNAERLGFRVAYTRTKWGLDRRATKAAG